MHAYIVKTADGYLYPFAGDVSLTDREDQAGHYLSTGEAAGTAERLGYKEGSFRVIAVEVEDAKLIRQ